MRTRGRRLFIYFLAAAVAAGTAAFFGLKRPKTRVAAPALAMTAPEPPRRTLPPLPARPLTPRLKALRARAMETASRLRGLEWAGEVGMTELSGWEYGTRTKEIAEVIGTDDLKGLSSLAVAGGMLPEGTDLASLAVTFTAATAGATYSPLDKQVLLVSEGAKRGGGHDAGLLTHELVHALQDQHFDLLRMLLVRPLDFDREEALFALIEGDATSVERRASHGDNWARLTLDDITRGEDMRFAPYRRGIGALFPPLLTETFVFRYRDGLRFVEAMRRERPAVPIDEVFRRPPLSSEQVLHPEKYLSGEGPREVALDSESFTDEGWRLAASTPLGEIGVRGLLLAGVPVEEARRGGRGGGGPVPDVPVWGRGPRPPAGAATAPSSSSARAARRSSSGAPSGTARRTRRSSSAPTTRSSSSAPPPRAPKSRSSSALGARARGSRSCGSKARR